MKKLVLILGIVFVVMSSFNQNENLEMPTHCFNECDDRASSYAATNGWTAEQEFNFFSDCYFTYCSGGNDGMFEFPNGNQY